MDTLAQFILDQEAGRLAPRPVVPEGPGREHDEIRSDDGGWTDDIGNEIDCHWECAPCHAEFSALAAGATLATWYRPRSFERQCRDGYRDVPPACLVLFGPGANTSERDMTLAQLERIGGWIKRDGTSVLHRYALNRDIEDPIGGAPGYRRETHASEREPQGIPNHAHDWTLEPVCMGEGQEATCSGAGSRRGSSPTRSRPDRLGLSADRRDQCGVLFKGNLDIGDSRARTTRANSS